MTHESGDTLDGIDVPAVAAWLGERVEITGTLHCSLIAGGRSNLTYEASDDANGHWVVRRPPLGHVLATAHDMVREHRIISALASTDVPVAPVVGLCDDESVIGAPFYVMDFVEGTVLRDQATAEASYDQATRAHIGDELVEVLDRIHAVDPASVGLDELGRHSGYIDRQLRRWYQQFSQSKLRDIPAVDRVHDGLAARVPLQQATTIVHGDYRLDNTLLDARGNVAAVLDWEICTLGDPLADLGLLSVYWTDVDDPIAALGAAPTLAAGFPRRAELVDRYAKVSTLDLSEIEFYVAFGFWKLACILEGVYSRYAQGAMGEGGRETAALFADLVVSLADEAERRLEVLR